MPPSRHSSSHHSSSHRSSHSSSHHSSSRSYSSHRSSHSSSHSSGSSFGSSFSGFSSRSQKHVKPSRIRRNQPTGYQVSASSISRYKLQQHDYDYFPFSWDTPEGKHYEEGYYDEDGQYYKNIFVPGESLMLSCEYCGNKMLYTCREGELPSCSKCGAQFKIDITDQKAEPEYVPTTTSRSQSYASKIILRIIVIVICVYFSGCAIAMIAGVALTSSRRGGNEGTGSSTKNSVYVEEIGRTCYLDGDDWYDSETECWFWFNDEVEPYQWQYWYEGISSDYGDYGWMEYNMDEDKWYIEVKDGQWVELPHLYNTSKLWHFTDEYTNPF